MKRVIRTISTCSVVLSVLGGCAAAGVEPLSEGTRVMIRRDIAYGSLGGQTLSLDACLPTTGNAPRVVIVHGGSFVGGSRGDDDVSTLCRRLAEGGYAAFSIDYRLAPAAVFPDQVDDVVAALNFLAAPQQRRAFNTGGPNAVLGLSAGGVITEQIATGILGRARLAEPVDAAVALSGGSDFARLGSETDALRVDVGTYFGCASTTPGNCPLARAASPIRHVSAEMTPLLLVNSEHELVPASQATRMVTAAEAVGGDVSIVLVPGAAHAAGVFDSDPDVAGDVESFLSEHHDRGTS